MDDKRLFMKEIRSLIENNRKNKAAITQLTEQRRHSKYDGKYMTGIPFEYDIQIDGFTKGTMMQYPHGAVARYGDLNIPPIYYRGEIKDYRTPCRSSLGRSISGKPDEYADVEIFLSYLRICSLHKIIYQFDQVKNWGFGHVFGHVIAQHYGIKTPYLDITDDIDVALFFASCIPIGENRYRPFKGKDFQDYGEYAVLYHRSSYQFEPSFMSDPTEQLNDVLPIGYQPFMRCYRQRGYYIRTFSKTSIGAFDLVKTLGFKKYIFSRSVKLSEEIFEYFHNGNDLFPYDALGEIADALKYIENTRLFSSDVFEAAFKAINDEHGIFPSHSKDDWIVLLEKNNISVNGVNYLLPLDKIKKVNAGWNVECFVEDEGLAPGYRLVSDSL